MKYELTIIIDKDFPTEDATKKINELVKSVNGIIQKSEIEKDRRLAYPIMGKEIADYYFLDIKLDGMEEASELSEKLNIQDWVLRYLLVKADTRK